MVVPRPQRANLTRTRLSANDRGISLVEIIVAMFLLTILAIAVLPIFARTMQLTADNVVVAKANQIVNAQLDLARKQVELTATCAAVRTLDITTKTAVPGNQGEGLSYTRVVAACPATYPDTVAITATVYRASNGTAISSATTLVALTGSGLTP